MPKTNKKQTTYAFIDSQNLNLGVKSQGWKLDFKRFRVLLSEKYGVEKALLFIGNVPGNESLYAWLQKVGYIVILKPTLVYKKGKQVRIKGNVDAELVLHSMIEWSNYDKSILVTGDGDFHCLVEHLDNKEKLKKIIVPNKKFSTLLRKFGKYIVNINNFKDKVAKKNRRHSRGI
ncbi:MAG: NYN domain-containing protein [Patescibacteria group bacterium]